MNVNDGKYVGELSPEEVISQFKYRAGIHLSYINLLIEEPGQGWEAYGTKEFHAWAVNGYEEGIRHLQDYISGAVRPQSACVLSQAVATGLNNLWMAFGKETRFAAIGK